MVRRQLVASFFTSRQEYQVRQAADVREVAERRGFPIQVLDAEENGVLQIQQLFRFIHAPEEERPFAFIVQTQVPDGLVRLARNAAGAGIGWILLNRVAPYLEALRSEHPKLAASAVTTDNAEIGRIQARQFRALLPRGGSLLYLQGAAQTAAAQVRLEAMKAGIQGAGINVKVVPAEWTETSGQQAVTAWLRLKTSELFKPDLVGCQNDALAVGARKALESHRPEWAGIPYTGCDGLPEGGERLVRTGRLAATIVVASCAGTAVDLLDRAEKTGEVPPPSVVVPPRSFPEPEALGKGRP
jgi:ABC-type sugar transport system substrate-binding protein